VPEAPAILLDQNVPRELGPWLREIRPAWTVFHASEVGLAGKSDRDLFEWAQARGALILTFDEDFADRRSFPVGEHAGVVRLRVWPTTIEAAQAALRRLLTEVPDEELSGALVIVDRSRIRIRRHST